jgi:hypothetical protein
MEKISPVRKFCYKYWFIFCCFIIIGLFLLINFGIEHYNFFKEVGFNDYLQNYLKISLKKLILGFIFLIVGSFGISYTVEKIKKNINNFFK